MIKNKGFTDDQVAFIMRQLLYGVNVLHEMGICHRDLRPENILVDEDTDEGPIIKITDFSQSSFINDDQDTTKQVSLGTRYFMAPELIDKKVKYDVKVDIWSIGVMAFFLLTNGKYPFSGKKKADVD